MRRAVPGRRLFAALLWALLISELVGIGAIAGVSGHFEASQFIGFVIAIGGPVFLLQGDQRARLWMAGVLLALAAYGAVHMLSRPHQVTLHSLILVTQSVYRLGIGILLFCPIAKRFVRASRSRGET